jgi:AcrR family transcriptional regulator
MTTPEPGMSEKILFTARGLFIRHGYHGLAMRQIAESLGVSKPAIYYHFKDKESLFLAILNDYLDAMETAIDRITSEPVSSREKIRQFMEYVLVQPSEQSAIIHLARQEMGQLSEPARRSFEQAYRRKFIGKIEAIFQTGMQQGEFKPIKPEVATWTLLGLMLPYFYPAYAKTSGLSTEVIQEITTVYLEGIIK